ncbi:ETS homologous factor isoform X2 [Clupea harengus]|uniref:ETS homologous factor n=1 Tax=Clupea harengus TaxID=7950 RepID=A0A6P8FCR7_CLUHA|nr:ETS homologous factor isoform X2 [Clupea harengus]
MVRHTGCSMSVLPSVSAESQLSAPWASHYPTTDVSMVTPSYAGRLWAQETQPQYWTKFQVWEWLQQTLDVHQIDAASIPFQNFDMDGRQLCNMSFQDFTRAAGPMGSILYQSLADMKWSSQYAPEIFPTMDIKTEIDEFPCSLLPFKEEPAFFPASVPLSSPSPSSPDPKRSNTRPHPVKKHNPRGTHLWEFIRDILLNPERNPGLIKWEDRSEGVFRFLKSEAVAQLWGKKKNNSSMTYEKLSRAMRYYYKREILERVDGRRLVYKFGRNAQGWRESEK